MCDALKDAFNNCVINFDRRVNVTDLLQKYELGYEEVHKTLEEHLLQQESKGVKYEKRFLVQGMEKENDTEVYTVVQGEKNLPEFLDRLQQAQARLYSVEIAGGAKSPAYAFKPVESHAITLRSLKVSNPKIKFQPAPLTNGSTTSSAAENADAKPATKKPTGMNMFAKQSAASASTSSSKTNGAKESTTAEKKSSPVKKPSPDKKKPSPTENKSKKNAALPYKKGINNFFGAATAKKEETVPKKDEVKKELKSNSPQKQQDLLKKQAIKTKAEKLEEEPSTSKKKKSPPKSNAQVKANTSVQLFAEDSSDSSSDEEKKTLAYKDEEKNPSDYVPIPAATGYKRTRITDSDEEDAEEPPPKVEKIESSSEPEVVDINEDDVQVKSETFLDEEGFVMTIKPKKTNTAKKGSSKKSIKARSPRKTPTKAQTTKSQISSKPAAVAAKTKQGNIMNFFGKK